MKQASKLFLTAILMCATTVSYADNTTNSSDTTMPPATDEKKALTGTFDITTNYIFRGISNSNNNPAFQGGLTYTFLTTGIYFNIWGSNVDFLDPQGNQATVEADGTVGITNDINDNWSYDINFERYNYPKASGSNYNEVMGALTYKVLTLSIGESLNVYNSHANGTYYNALVNIPVPRQYVHFDGVSVEGSVGHYSLPQNKDLYSYNDFMAGIDKTWGMYDLLVQYTDTSHPIGEEGLANGTLLATLTANF